jgi:hypothetical protein
MEMRTGSWTPWSSLPLTRGWRVLLNTGTTVSPESSRTKLLITVKRKILISRSARENTDRKRGTINLSAFTNRATSKRLTEPVADTHPRSLREGKYPRPAIRQVVAVGHARGVEPPLGHKCVGVGTPHAREAVDGARGDVDDLALCDGDAVEDALAVRGADWPAQGDDIVGLDHFLGVRRRGEDAEPVGGCVLKRGLKRKRANDDTYPSFTTASKYGKAWPSHISSNVGSRPNWRSSSRSFCWRGGSFAKAHRVKWTTEEEVS